MHGNREEAFSLSKCLDSSQFVLLSAFTLTICLKMRTNIYHCSRMQNVYFQLMLFCHTAGGGGVLLEFLGGDVPQGPRNP